MPTSVARRVLPTPPTPVSVTRRWPSMSVPMISSSWLRPTKLVSGAGRLVRMGAPPASRCTSGMGAGRLGGMPCCAAGVAGRWSAESSPRATRTKVVRSCGASPSRSASNSASCCDGRRSSASILRRVTAAQPICIANSVRWSRNSRRRLTIHCPNDRSYAMHTPMAGYVSQALRSSGITTIAAMRKVDLLVVLVWRLRRQTRTTSKGHLLCPSL